MGIHKKSTEYSSYYMSQMEFEILKFLSEKIPIEVNLQIIKLMDFALYKNTERFKISLLSILMEL